jgi:hypothetical protein
MQDSARPIAIKELQMLDRSWTVQLNVSSGSVALKHGVQRAPVVIQKENDQAG